MTNWIIKLKRPLRSNSVYVLCYGKNQETALAKASPYALRKPEDAIRGTSAPVIIRAPSSTSAFRKAVSFIRTRTDYRSYEPRVTRL